MCGVPYQSFVSSKPFLVVGPGKRLFYAHGALLAGCSPVLRRDVNGGMQEAQLQTIEIQDVEGDIDDDTVLRFIEYAYSGDYTVPDPDIVQLPTDTDELQEAFKSASPVPAGEIEWIVTTENAQIKKDKKKKLAKRLARYEEPSRPSLASPIAEEACAEHTYAGGFTITRLQDSASDPGPSVRTVLSDRQSIWAKFRDKASPLSRGPAWLPRDNNDEREDYISVFLCHARLYKFSDRYGCEGLMELALQKLRLTLSRYTFHSVRASDVVELIRYTYTHTADLGPRMDKLRELVLEYVVCYFRELIEQRLFVELLHDGGPLCGDVMSKVAKIVA